MSTPGSSPGERYRRAGGSSRRGRDMDESTRTALMHLEMIYQAAAGDYSPRAGELEKRKAAVVAFMLTGQRLADDSDRALIAKVNEAVNSHFSAVSDQTAELGAQPDAA